MSDINNLLIVGDSYYQTKAVSNIIAEEKNYQVFSLLHLIKKDEELGYIENFLDERHNLKVNEYRVDLIKRASAIVNGRKIFPNLDINNFLKVQHLENKEGVVYNFGGLDMEINDLRKRREALKMIDELGKIVLLNSQEYYYESPTDVFQKKASVVVNTNAKSAEEIALEIIKLVFDSTFVQKREIKKMKQ